jgi:hypothetical protein
MFVSPGPDFSVTVFGEHKASNAITPFKRSPCNDSSGSRGDD